MRCVRMSDGREPAAGVEPACSDLRGRRLPVVEPRRRVRQPEGNRTPASAFTGPRAGRYTTGCVNHRPEAGSDPGWIRTTDLLRVREAPSPLGHEINQQE